MNLGNTDKELSDLLDFSAVSMNDNLKILYLNTWMQGQNPS